MTTRPNFSQFRSGTPLNLSEGGQVSYAELKKSGLQEHYLRIVHDLAGRDKLTRAQIGSLTARAASSNRREQQAVRAELEALRTPPAKVATPPPPKPNARTGHSGRRKTEKVFELVSSGDHKQAVKLAQSYGLHPVQILEQALRPGQSPEAHTVRALGAVASKLITSGWWKTV